MAPETDLFSQHQDWALHIARDRARRLPRSVQLRELESAALEGLWQAAARWDGTRDFRPFAMRRIKGAMIDWLRSTQPLGYRRSGTRPAPDARIHSLFLFIDASKSPETYADQLGDPLAGDEVRQVEDRDHVERLLCFLRPDDRAMMRLYWLDGLRMSEIGERFGYSESRISQRLSAALARLQTVLFQQSRQNCRSCRLRSDRLPTPGGDHHGPDR